MNVGKISAIAILLLSFFVSPNSTWAKYSGGSGSSSSPYQIGTVQDLLDLEVNTSDYGKYFILTDDIDLTSAGTFTAAVIAPDMNDINGDFNGVPFTGTFDGKGYKITRLTIDGNSVGNSYLGLFGKIKGGKIKNLELEDVNISGKDNSQFIGALAGYSQSSYITDCCSSGTVSGGNYSSAIGGLVGESSDSNLSRCFSVADVAGARQAEGIGGLVGVSDSNGIIKNCCSAGTVSGQTRAADIGGLAGYCNKSNVIDCCSASTADGQNYCEAIGGLAGYSEDSNIIDCCSSGTVSGGDHSGAIGGLVGYSYESNISDCCSSGTVIDGNYCEATGGLVGYSYYSNISKCFSTGTVTGGDNSYSFGGLAGESYDSNVSNCYSKSVVTGGNSSSYFGGLIGYNSSNNNINSCYSRGNVIGGDNSSYFGGLVGFNSSNSNINDCYSKGTVTDGNNSSCLGGLVGQSRGGVISECYATGPVSSKENSSLIGGLAGDSIDSNISICYSTSNITSEANCVELGGLTGRNAGEISNCYAIGDVNGGDNCAQFGGLAGNNLRDSSISFCYSAGDVNVISGSYGLGGLAGTSLGSINRCYFLNTSGPGNGNGTPLTDAKMKQQTSFVGWNFNTIWTIRKGLIYPELASLIQGPIQITKCTVTAGSKPNTDKISFSGTMDAATGDILAASNIHVIIDSNNLVTTCDLNFPVNDKTFKNNKYSYSATDSNITKSFTYDVNTYKFALSASRLDLSGLGCPLTIGIIIGDYNVTTDLDEDIVNGSKKPIPIQLMTDVNNVLRVDKCTVTQSKKSNKDILSAKGAFTVETSDPCMVHWTTEDLGITLDTLLFTVPAAKLKPGKGKFTCSRAPVTDGNAVATTATATFNFTSCTFTVIIRDANIIPDINGIVDFGVAFADFNEVREVNIP